jgi:hypothetical protein
VGAGGHAVSSVQDVVQLSAKEEEGKYTNSYSSVFGLCFKTCRVQVYLKEPFRLPSLISMSVCPFVCNTLRVVVTMIPMFCRLATDNIHQSVCLSCKA